MELDQKIIEELLKTDLLSESGAAYRNAPVSNDLEQIEESARGIEWENMRLQKVGDLTVFLTINHRDLFRCWNEMVKQAKEKVLPHIEKRLDRLLHEKKITQAIAVAVRYDIVCIIMVETYSRYFKSDFYEMLKDVYLAGYFPYGWAGAYPEGKMLVY